MTVTQAHAIGPEVRDNGKFEIRSLHCIKINNQHEVSTNK